jgi:hypothetical protein
MQKPPKYPDWEIDRIRLADSLMASAPGKRAADEGWIIALHDFCRERSRLPNADEEMRIKSASLARIGRIRRMLAVGPHFVIKPMIRAVTSKRIRLERLANVG